MRRAVFALCILGAACSARADFPLYRAPFQAWDGPSNLNSLARGDLDGDGRIDLVGGALEETSQHAGGLYVWFGSAGAGFEAPRRLGVLDGSVERVAVADMNGDGRNDVIATTWTSLGLVVALQRAGGGFDLRGVAGIARGLGVADFNGDGRLDIVTGNAAFLGHGDGTFAAPLPFGVLSNTQAVAVVDVNGDARLDLLLADTDAGTYAGRVHVLVGRGDGTFMPASVIGVGNFPCAVDCGDVNGDGYVDAIVANFYETSLSVLFGHGDGTFHEVRVPGTSFAQGALLADVTGDASLDIVMGSFCRPFATLWTGRGDGTFLPPIRLEAGEDVVAALAQDVDGDGRTDLLVGYSGCHGGLPAQFAGGGLAVHLRSAEGTLQAPPALSARAPYTAVGADFDADGTTDLAVTNENARSIAVLRGGAPAFTLRTTLNAAGVPYGLAAADWTGDGYPDVIVSTVAPLALRMYPGVGDGTFGGAQTFATGVLTRSIHPRDVDQDGRMDLVVADIDAAAVAVFFGDGTGQFPRRANFPVAGPAQGACVDDLDRDGWPDVVAACGSFNGISILYGAPGGVLGRRLDLATGTDPRVAVIGAVDRDAHPDLVVANRGSGTLAVYLGHQHGSLERQPDVPVGGIPSSVVLAPLDGDNRSDLAVTDAGRYEVMLFLGDGRGAFDVGPQFGTGRRPRSLVAADLDRDRDVDLVVCNQESDDVQVLWNRTGGPRTSAGGTHPSRMVLRPDVSSPAGARATARFDLQRAIAVTVRVFDMAGRRVQEFPYVPQAPGGQRMTWDVTALPSGLYFVQLQAGGATATRKFAVLH